MDKRSLIAELSAKRLSLRSGLDTLLNTANTAGRALTEDESARFDREEAEVRQIDEQIKSLDEQIRADEQHAETMRRYAPTVTITSEPEVYRKSGKHSYFKDLYRAKYGTDRDAVDRLVRNDKMVAEKRAGLTTVNGAGGEFVPPAWLESEFVRLARPGRVTANLIPTEPLPAGTDSLNIPKVTSGSAVDIQGTQNTAIQETELQTSSVASSVFTVAGGQTVSLQLIEQSPLNIDTLVLEDLSAAYAVKLNTLILTGSGSAGQPMGIMTLTGTNSADCPTPSGAQTLAGNVYGAVANGVQLVHTNRFMPADRIVMHPRRWASLLSQVDSAGRPLVVPAAGTQGTGFNLIAEAGEVAAQGFAGTMQGLPVFLDALIPTNLTADTGSGEDAILVARFADLKLWESDIRAETFQQTYANNLSVFIRLYNYASFQPARYPKSISVVTGSALSAPVFI